ncbi:MAG: c-type cytochrome [Myxococcota bacterium]
MSRSTPQRLGLSLFALALGVLTPAACNKPQPTTTPEVEPSTSGSTESKKPAPTDAGHGGRLYDKWYAEIGGEPGFAPGERGGPHGDGTLDDGNGQPMAHDGHSYRLKNLFGWDLRGAEGIYGPEYQNKSYVLPVNLMTDERTPDELMAWIRDGGDGMPAYGAVLDETQLRELVTFIDDMRSGRVPRADQVWALSKDAPKNYTLLEGGDAARGTELVKSSCASCHGPDGRWIPIDDKYSLGAYSRAKAYESWIKIVSGQPNTPMHREIEFTDGADGAQQVLDILAALCDRGTFPGLDGQEDVPNGDPRCGAYLK